MKKLVRLGVLMVMALSLAACQSSKATSEQSVADGKETVSVYLEDLKTGKFSEAQGQLETVPENFAFGDNDVMKQFFTRMVYEVKDVKVTGEETVVTLNIKLPNTSAIYDNMMDNIGEEVQKLQAGDDTSKTKASSMMVEYLLKQINNEKVQMAENTVEVKLKKVDGKTVIIPNDELSKALSGIVIQK